MKRFLLTLVSLILLVTATSNTVAQDFVWAKQLSGTGDEYAESMTMDSNGNIYTVGAFQGTLDCDPGPGIFNLVSTGGYDVYVSKLDSSGNFIWAKQLSGTADSHSYSVVTNSTGEVYIGGFFIGTADFNPGGGTFNLVATGDFSAFVWKLDSSGDLVWAGEFEGNSGSLSYVKALVVNSSDNVYMTGDFLGTVDFDPSVNTFNLTSTNPGSRNSFVLALDQDGALLWAKQFEAGTASQNQPASLALDASSNVYIVGHFLETNDFDPGVGVFNLTSVNNYDVFVCKLDSSGNFIWAGRLGGTADDNARDVAVDASGNIYTVGYFQNTADFDPSASTANLNSAGNIDVFISKLDTDGNYILARRFGGTGEDQGNSIGLDTSGNIYTVGNFSATADFDPGAGTFNLITAGGYDIFVSKLTAEAAFSWAKQLGGEATDKGNDIKVDTDTNVYTVGNFIGRADFDPGPNTYNFTPVGQTDVFISKLGPINQDGDGDGFSPAQGDCDDSNNTIYPGARERCDGLDNDCDLQVDELVDVGDVDGDGWVCAADCAEGNAAIHPGVPDPIDTIDNDCDGVVDEDNSTVTGIVAFNAPGLVPVQGAQVRLCELYPNGTEASCISTTSDANGSYSFTSVPTGNFKYHVVAKLTWVDYVVTAIQSVQESRFIETKSNDFQLASDQSPTPRNLIFPTPIVLVYGRNGGACLNRSGYVCSTTSCDGAQAYWTVAEQMYREAGYMTFVADGHAPCSIPQGSDNDSLHDYNAGQLKNYIFNHVEPKIGVFTNNQLVPVDLVAHSMGGLTARAMIASKINQSPNPIRMLVMIGTPNAGIAGADDNDRAERIKPGAKYLGQRDLWYFNQSYGDSVDQFGVPFYYVSGSGGSLFGAFIQPTPNDDIVSRQSVVDYNVAGQRNLKFRISNECLPKNQTQNCLIRIPADQNLYLCTADNHGGLISNTTTLNAVLDVLEHRLPSNSNLLCPDRPGALTSKSNESVELTEFFTRTTRVSDGTLLPLTSVQHSHVIDASPESTFFLEWNTGTMSMTLEEPGGRSIDPAVAASDPLIEYVDGSTSDDPVVGYIITNPVDGSWDINITAGSNVNALGEDYVATTTSEAPIDAEFSSSDDLVSVGSTIDLYLAVTDQDMTITGATVTAVSEDRFGSQTLLTCLDNGVAPDTTLNDGTYSCSYGPLTVSGNHSLAFQVSGTNLATDPFERASFSELSVNSDSASLDGTFTEFAIDSDSNNLNEALAIDVDVTVVEAGTYSLSGLLVDNLDNPIDSRVTSSVVLPTGSATIRLEFEGFLIREHGVAGPYTLTDLRLNRSDEDRALCDSADDVYTTATYSPTDFEIRDPDGDGIASGVDNCPNIPNPLQEDGDTDTVGDVCDNCPINTNATQADADVDTFGDACDLCPSTSDAFQNDTDGDTLGDNCDTDADGDTVANMSDCQPLDNAVWSVAREATGLTFQTSSQLIWDAATPADGSTPSYDVVKGDLMLLRSYGNFSQAVCFAAHIPSNSVSDAGNPATGGGFYFLTRVRTGCGPGDYGQGTAGTRIITACP